MPKARIQPHLARSGAVSSPAGNFRMVSETLVMVRLRQQRGSRTLVGEVGVATLDLDQSSALPPALAAATCLEGEDPWCVLELCYLQWQSRSRASSVRPHSSP